MEIKVLELFSGYGTTTFALKRLGIDYELIGYSDIDKYANQCFKQNHCPEDKKNKLRFGDVREINPEDLGEVDLISAGFPCQAFSIAGMMKGEADPRGTLFYEIIRIAEVKKPKYMLLENVKGLTSKNFKATFNTILRELKRIGYNVYWRVLNSKDYGIPQNRQRVWFVCLRKDLDKPFVYSFNFPKKKELKIFIKDILEDKVDEKYYLSEKLQERFRKYLEEKNRKLGEKEPAILDLYNKKVKTDGTSITISNPCHNNLRLIEGKKNTAYQWRRSYVRENKSGVIPTEKSKRNVVKTGKIRRLSPTECFRLMGFLNDEIDLDGLSDTQLYKLAGNGQDVNVVTLIYENLLKDYLGDFDGKN